MKKRILFLSGLIISAFFLYLALRGIAWSEVKRSLLYMNPIWVFPATALFVPGYFLRGLRWKLILSPVKECKTVNLISTIIISFMINNLFPLRMGELARAYIIGQKEGMSKSSALATVVMERTFDGLTLVFLFSISFLSYALLRSVRNLRIIGGLALGTFAGVFLLILVLIHYRDSLPSRVQRLCSLLSSTWAEKASHWVESFLQGFMVIKEKRLIAYIAGCSILIWLIEGFGLYLLSRAFGLGINYPIALSVMTISCIGIAIPAAPGYIGTYEAFVRYSLAIFSVSGNKAFSFAIFVHTLYFVLILSTGLFFLNRQRLTFSELKKNI